MIKTRDGKIFNPVKAQCWGCKKTVELKPDAMSLLKKFIPSESQVYSFI